MIKEQLQWLRELLLEHPVDTVLTCVLVYLGAESVVKYVQGRTNMDPRRERWVNQCVAEFITEGVERFRAENLLSDEECELIYKRAGNHLKAYDLLPRKSLLLKQEIRNRLASMWARMTEATKEENPDKVIKKKRTFTPFI